PAERAAAGARRASRAHREGTGRARAAEGAAGAGLTRAAARASSGRRRRAVRCVDRLRPAKEALMALRFGVTVLPDPPYTRFLELIELAERHGFDYGWTYDSHVLWHEATPLLALAVDRTTRMKFGHFVTNPGTREPTVLASMYATLHVISE